MALQIKYRITALFILAAVWIFYPTCLYALIESEESVLSMYFEKDNMTITQTRYLKPVSQSAENIVVITAEEIRNLNAHTLQDVIKYVTGTFIEVAPGGIGGLFRIQGSQPQQARVLIDGITLNDLSLATITPNTISVQNIERIEIIKGPASSVWGASLGGVINIITKDAGGTKSADVTAYASYGAYNTMDDRLEARGTMNKFGYYVSAGRTASDGYSGNLPVDEKWVYAKLRYDVTNDFQIGMIGSYSNDMGQPVQPILNSDSHRAYFVLNGDYHISDEASIKASFRSMSFNNTVIPNAEGSTSNVNLDEDYGGSIIFNWNKSIHSIVVGSDYDYMRLSTNLIERGTEGFTKYAIFINDTIVLDKFAVTPGLRYDYFNVSGNFLSPSLGITYQAGRETILRLIVARGFNTPAARQTSVTMQAGPVTFLANNDLRVEKVMSYQLGAEMALLKYLWLKTTLFRHDVTDAIELIPIEANVMQATNSQKEVRQGFEFELSTIPVYNTTLSSGFTFIDARDKDTGSLVSDTPRYSIDIGVEYNDRRTFRASLKGHYAKWIINPSEYNNNYTFFDNSFIWDINASKQIYKDKYIKTELFLKGSNLFNDSQFLYANRNYNGRIVEFGVRAEF
ncbi:MAG: TonB-dependent receptor [Nitrospirae bacterium]|nr:TonB-dependent receptor [Nitrospirota bacterium]